MHVYISLFIFIWLIYKKFSEFINILLFYSSTNSFMVKSFSFFQLFIFLSFKPLLVMLLTYGLSWWLRYIPLGFVYVGPSDVIHLKYISKANRNAKINAQKGWIVLAFSFLILLIIKLYKTISTKKTTNAITKPKSKRNGNAIPACISIIVMQFALTVTRYSLSSVISLSLY